MQLSMRAANVTEVLSRFSKWWWKEFIELFPAPWVQFLIGGGRPRLVIAPDGDQVTLELWSSAQVLMTCDLLSAGGNLAADIDRVLQTHNLMREDAEISIRLPHQLAFVRRVVLPVEALDAVDVILMKDLAMKTPFKVDDVYSGHVVRGRDDERVTVIQSIIRRRFVHEALHALNLNLEDVSSVLFGVRADADELSTPSVRLKREVDAGPAWSKKALPALGFAAIVLVLVAGGLKYWRQEKTLAKLDVEITTVDVQAKQVRRLVDQLKEKRGALLQLRLKRNEAPGLIDIWEESTRLLPSHSWLSELRLAEVGTNREEHVTLVGFSTAAPSLVAIIDGSPLFFETALVSPIAFDSAEGRERFTLQTKLRVPELLKEATR